MKEEDRIDMLRHRNHILGIIGCEINLMSGAELADFAINNNIQSIRVDLTEEIKLDTFRSYNGRGDE